MDITIHCNKYTYFIIREIFHTVVTAWNVYLIYIPESDIIQMSHQAERWPYSAVRRLTEEKIQNSNEIVIYLFMVTGIQYHGWKFNNNYIYGIYDYFLTLLQNFSIFHSVLYNLWLMNNNVLLFSSDSMFVRDFNHTVSGRPQVLST